MEPGEKAAMHAQHMEEMHGHPHVHGPPAQPAPVDMKPKQGVMATVAGFVGKMQKVGRKRKAGNGVGANASTARHVPLRQASVAAREVELEDATTRTQKDYHKLSKRTSIL